MGHDLNRIAEKHTQLLHRFAHDVPAQQAFRAYLTLCQLLSAVLASLTGFKRHLRQYWQEQVVEVIDQMQHTVKLEEALKLLHLSRSTYQAWLVEVKHRCGLSPLDRCQRIWPQQLTPHEVQTMKSLLQDEQYRHWPIASLALRALRKGWLKVSVKTWYKYAHLLGLRRRRYHKSKKRRIGIRAAAPNEVWHVDVTKVPLADGRKAYVHLLVDNFSRCILAWRASLQLKAAHTVELIREAYQQVNAHQRKELVTLLVDGGSENHAAVVEQYLKLKEVGVRKVIGLKEVDSSNSMVEAVNKILKYGYLFRQPVNNLGELHRVLQEAVEDYCHQRPHYALGGLTPYEALLGKQLPDEWPQRLLVEGKRKRLAENRKRSCQGCRKEP